MTTRLIINADDLGAGPATDRGIFRSLKEGIVTSASLLANGPSFPTAAAQARALGLAVGVHLNLSEGRPLAGPIAGLTTVDGAFPGKAAARRLLAAALPDPDNLRRELAAQVETVFAAGLTPDHLDTHQHLFLFPQVRQAVIETARASGLRALRRPAPAEAAESDPPSPLGDELRLYRRLGLAKGEDGDMIPSDLAAPDGLWGMAWLDRLDEAALGSLLGSLPAGTWELMVHPGEAGDPHPFSTRWRRRELDALTSPAIRALVDSLDLQLITFGDLACAS